MSHDRDQDHRFVKLVDGWMETQHGPNMSWIDTSSRFALEKIARATGTSTTHVPRELQAKIAELQGKLPKDKVAFYNRALGCAEAYGVNKNGDQWRRDELVRKHATFVESARYYRHHANKAGIDPDFGRPVASAYNPRTDMVDLIIVADLDKQAQEDIQRLERGLSVPTSMGCKVKFDVCLICGNQARHRGEYCEHVKEAASYPYGMCHVLPDGRVCGVDNPDPVFFDISRVTNPAFMGSENLKKVASNESQIIIVSSAKRAEDAGLMTKTAAIKGAVRAEKAQRATRGQKLADMIKELPGRVDGALAPSGDKLDAMVPAAKAMCKACPAPKGKIKSLAKSAGADRLLSTAAAMGLVLSPEEFSELVDDADVAWPTAEDILTAGATKTAMDMLSAPIDAAVAAGLMDLARERSFLQPCLLNAMAKVADHCDCAPGSRGCANWKCRGGVPRATRPTKPTKSKDDAAAADKTASDMYVGYRAALLARAHVVDADGDRVAMKMAETCSRLATKSSAAFALLAFCRDGMGQENVEMNATQILAKQSEVVDNPAGALRVTGSMADGFGEDVLETLADNCLQSFHRSR